MRDTRIRMFEFGLQLKKFTFGPWTCCMYGRGMSRRCRTVQKKAKYCNVLVHVGLVLIPSKDSSQLVPIVIVI